MGFRPKQRCQEPRLPLDGEEGSPPHWGFHSSLKLNGDGGEIRSAGQRAPMGGEIPPIGDFTQIWKSNGDGGEIGPGFNGGEAALSADGLDSLRILPLRKC